MEPSDYLVSPGIIIHHHIHLETLGIAGVRGDIKQCRRQLDEGRAKQPGTGDECDHLPA